MADNLKNTAPVRWGIIGAGRIARTFARDIAFSTDAQLVAVAARQQAKADAFAAEFSLTTAYGSYQAMFESDEVDAVYIATPHNFHFEQVRAAIIAGKHVLCEKPITVSVHECQQLTELAAEHKVFLMEAMWTYFLPAVQQALVWVKDGRIGKLKHVQASFGYPMPFDVNDRAYNPDLAGGCVWDLGVYPLALNLLFHPDMPLSIKAWGQIASTGVEDDATMVLEYQDSIASLHCSFQCKLPNRACIVGTEGYIEIPDFFRAHQANLFHLDDCIEQFEHQRLGSGFEFEIQAASESILAGNMQNTQMPWQISLALQQQMTDVLALLKRG